jgi:hypothetical protein
MRGKEKTVDIIFHYYLKDIMDYELNMLVHHMGL